MNNITIIYITANRLTDTFAENVRKELLKAAGDIPIISVSKKPIKFGIKNLVFPEKASIYHEYKETLAGVKEAKTKYIAICEDDSLYTPNHFAHIPAPGSFDFNIGCWGIYTWIRPAIYNLKYRRNHNELVCERDLYIDAMEERFKKYPDENNYPNRYFGEPGRYEDPLGVSQHLTGEFISEPPIIRLSHDQDCYGWKLLGKRKKMGPIQAYDIPYWGSAEKLLKKIYG